MARSKKKQPSAGLSTWVPKKDENYNLFGMFSSKSFLEDLGAHVEDMLRSFKSDIYEIKNRISRSDLFYEQLQDGVRGIDVVHALQLSNETVSANSKQYMHLQKQITDLRNDFALNKKPRIEADLTDRDMLWSIKNEIQEIEFRIETQRKAYEELKFEHMGAVDEIMARLEKLEEKGE